ncbi:hypothetical protein PGT21_027682 [Puccinia graminis f. sp. tritici]|uniref:Uncharacterized protein n=1 Tax=Puccinia graminis f. sp. tritici TaxID=56615 RepID=A0A5B0RWP8_PUCGR|nr:hypothetical protein PGT21_027682 [Puccinia graminis f. sp. tritici]KAA1128934.1 hypothetical protein PGTUg99_006703 [Puccinia graminis f. sp. tritici]
MEMIGWAIENQFALTKEANRLDVALATQQRSAVLAWVEPEQSQTICLVIENRLASTNKANRLNVAFETFET